MWSRDWELIRLTLQACDVKYITHTHCLHVACIFLIWKTLRVQVRVARANTVLKKGRFETVPNKAKTSCIKLTIFCPIKMNLCRVLTLKATNRLAKVSRYWRLNRQNFRAKIWRRCWCRFLVQRNIVFLLSYIIGGV